jgi:hypothetical protein
MPRMPVNLILEAFLSPRGYLTASSSPGERRVASEVRSGRGNWAPSTTAPRSLESLCRPGIGEAVGMSDLLDELDAWLDANWDPDLTVGEWWQRLGTSGWAAPALPANAYGKGVSRNEAIAVAQRIVTRGAVPAPGGLGMLLAAPTIAVHGTQEQIDQYVLPIVTGQAAWCQLFSEPGAGSDLAGLGTRAVKDGEEWIVNGQKVWTSGGHIADMGMLIARTDPDMPKHQGITWFAMDMHQGNAVDVRPLREMTGRALFNEVFLSEARVATPRSSVAPTTVGPWPTPRSCSNAPASAPVATPQRRWPARAPSPATCPSASATSCDLPAPPVVAVAAVRWPRASPSCSWPWPTRPA